MTIARVITDDKVDSTITETSSHPVSSSSVFAALGGKIDVDHGTEYAGKLLNNCFLGYFQKRKCLEED